MGDDLPKLPTAEVSLPGFPAGKPIPLDPVEGVDLPAYAAISAELVEKREPREAVLGRHGLNEAKWLMVEQAWPLRIAVAALRQDMSLAQTYDEHFIKAQDNFGASEPSHSLEDYAILSAGMQSGEAPALLLAKQGISLPDWGRLQRAWTHRLSRDDALNRRFAELVATAKQPKP